MNTLVATPSSLQAWASAPPAAPSAPPPPAQNQETWTGALALPAYTYGSASAALSGLTAFAERFPAGGITINPGRGIVANPEWTRAFGEGSVAARMAPVLAGLSAGIHLIRGGLELSEGMRANDNRLQVAGLLDLGIAGMSALQIASPVYGTVGAVALIAARAVVEVHS